LFLASIVVGCTRPARADVPQPPTRTVVFSMASAETLTARLSALESAREVFALSATEQELTSYALANLTGTPVQEVVIWLEPEGIHTQATVGAASDHEVYAFVTVACDKGVAQFGLRYAALDGHTVPRWILASAEKALNDALADMQTSFRIERIVLDTGTLLVDGSID